MSKNIEAVQAVYAAFERGDIPAVLQALAEEVDWRVNIDPALPGAGHPLFQRRSRRAEVVAFFEGLIGAFEPRGMEMRGLASTPDGRSVLVLFTEKYVVRRTGKPFSVDTIHHWTFNDQGLVVAWRGYTDTAAELAAAAG